MSNDKTEIIPSIPSIPSIPRRRSILHAARIGQPAARPERSPFADWRGRAQTEELPAVSSYQLRRNRPSRRSALARHLRCALAGALLAIVAISGISAYAAQGIADARQAAADHVRSRVSVPR